MNSDWVFSIAALAAIWAGGITRFLSKNERARNAIWCRVPEEYRFIVPFANAMLVGLGVSLAKGGGWKVALLETLSTTVAGGLGAIGGHAALKDSPLPYGNKDVATCDIPGEPQPGDEVIVEATFITAPDSLRAPSEPPPRSRRLPATPPKPE